MREPAHPEYEAQGAQLSAGRASQLEHESQLLIPGLFQALVGFGRPVLMEVACDSDSVLSRVIQEEVGCEGAALRASLWNGADLSTSAGVRMVLERIGLENPSTVWLSPPCGPFSPMQHTNARTPEQSEELKRKRDQAKRIYAGAAIVFRYCVQHGIHCAWEMSEKSDAWRLPVLQNLLRKFPLHVSVAHGCRVGLRDKTGKQLLRKGWKIVTTHAQLAASLQLLCKCPKSYNHGRCEGEATNRSAKYTPEFGRRVSKALLHELGSRGVQQECQGHSQLGEQFGEGLTCQCEDLPRDVPEKCGTCLFRDGLVPPKQASGISGNPRPQASQEETGPDFGGPEPLEEANYNRDEVQQAEELAKALEQNKDYRDSACEELLRQLPLQPHLSRKGQLGETRVNYFVFGAYAYGSQYGVAQRTRVLPHCVKYINHYLKHKDPNQRKWTSFVVNYNQAMPIHRDVNNQAQQPNLLIGLGNYTKGGVWVQETTQARDMGLQPGKMGAVCSRVTPLGETVWGRVWETRGKLVEFPPKAWHGTEPWVGERIALSAYTIRGQGQLQPEELQQLRKVGFPLPPQPTKQPWEAYPAQVTEGEKKREEERLKRQLYLLHAATGHCSTKHLLEALKRRNAKPEILKLAAEFKRSICEERKRVQPRHVASLEPLPPKFHTISADVGHWRHPDTGEHSQFMVVLDEGSRFRIAKVLSKGAKQQPSGATCVEYLREGWAQIFGNPRTLRLDPAGNFRSEAVSDYCHRNNVFLDLVPGEAHWKIGACEQAVQGLKTVMDKLCAADGMISAEEALATAVRTFNQRDLIRGFSPAQHVLGQVPDETGRIDVSTPALPPELLIENPNTEFQQAVSRRLEAEKAHAEWNAQQRLNRAANSRSRPVMDYQPGELVFYWRQQDSAKNKQGPSSKRGYFMGPARVLATESKRNPDGSLQPGSSVWCIRGRQLIKCCVEQLRRASPREELVESLVEHDRTPWSFTRVAEQIGGNQFEDVSEQRPSEREWWRSQDVTQEAPPTRHRFRGKRAAAAPVVEDSEEELIPAEERTPATSSRQRPRREAEFGECWWAQVAESSWMPTEQAYWQDQQASVEVEVDMPKNEKAWDAALRDFQCYMVGAMKRRAVEVREKHLSEEELKQFKEAKLIEVRNFLGAQAFELLPEHLKPSKEQAIGMRWILTWKHKEDGTRKAKARGCSSWIPGSLI